MKAAAEPGAPVSLLHQLLGGAGLLGGHCPSFLRLCPRRGEQGRQPAGVSAHLLYDFQGCCLSFSSIYVPGREQSFGSLLGCQPIYISKPDVNRATSEPQLTGCD